MKNYLLPDTIIEVYMFYSTLHNLGNKLTTKIGKN